MTVKFVTIDEGSEQQRLDNFLIKHLKGVPRSYIYRIVRKGEVRINKKRCKVSNRLQVGDIVRIPPVRMSEKKETMKPSSRLIELLNSRILYEDEQLMVLNKPQGLAVHAGTNIDVGVIEALRAMRPDAPFLELAHRIDRDTSGCLVIAKSRRTLIELHDVFREGAIDKVYLALTRGSWKADECEVRASLQKNMLESGERMVQVNDEGKSSLTIFKPVKHFAGSTLVEATIHTGRTHQIRVHAQSQGHPVAGDRKYGDKLFNKVMKARGVKRLFLHALRLSFCLPSMDKRITVVADLDEDLKEVLSLLSSLAHGQNDK